METRFEHILNGTEDDLVDELERVIKWARSLTPRQWAAINNDVRGGLRHFIREAMEQPV